VASFILVLCATVVLVLGLVGVVNLAAAGLLSSALAAIAGAKLIAAAVFGGGLRELTRGLWDLSSERRERKRRGRKDDD
jgi:hypothetical protein